MRKPERTLYPKHGRAHQALPCASRSGLCTQKTKLPIRTAEQSRCSLHQPYTVCSPCQHTQALRKALACLRWPQHRGRRRSPPSLSRVTACHAITPPLQGCSGSQSSPCTPAQTAAAAGTTCPARALGPCFTQPPFCCSWASRRLLRATWPLQRGLARLRGQHRLQVHQGLALTSSQNLQTPCRPALPLMEYGVAQSADVMPPLQMRPGSPQSPCAPAQAVGAASTRRLRPRSPASCCGAAHWVPGWAALRY